MRLFGSECYPFFEPSCSSVGRQLGTTTLGWAPAGTSPPGRLASGCPKARAQDTAFRGPAQPGADSPSSVPFEPASAGPCCVTQMVSLYDVRSDGSDDPVGLRITASWVSLGSLFVRFMGLGINEVRSSSVRRTTAVSAALDRFASCRHRDSSGGHGSHPFLGIRRCRTVRQRRSGRIGLVLLTSD